MGWLRHVIIDLAITAFILAATFGGQVWAAWVVWIYTPVMVLLKVGAFAGNVNPKSNEVPMWFFHALYALNLVVLLYYAWYWVAAGWVVIWLVSVATVHRSRPKARK